MSSVVLAGKQRKHSRLMTPNEKQEFVGRALAVSHKKMKAGQNWRRPVISSQFPKFKLSPYDRRFLGPLFVRKGLTRVVCRAASGHVAYYDRVNNI
jgi:hypothetical protein